MPCAARCMIRSAPPVRRPRCAIIRIACSISMQSLTPMAEIGADALCADYFERVAALMKSILDEERDPLDRAAARLADQIEADRLIHVYGPGGHSNLASQEIFFRAGGLMHVSAIL